MTPSESLSKDPIRGNGQGQNLPQNDPLGALSKDSLDVCLQAKYTGSAGSWPQRDIERTATLAVSPPSPVLRTESNVRLDQK